MELWLRKHAANGLHWDEKIQVRSEEEWREAISRPGIISSKLWPGGDRFKFAYRFIKRNHPHEYNYQHDPTRNADFKEACRRLAARLEEEIDGLRTLVYAPLRGAYPIWRGIAQFLPEPRPEVYFPVTSSFVQYPSDSPIRKPNGKRASGRYANILELQRLKPMLEDFDVFVYVDEIISGGMMRGHIKEMLALQIPQTIPIVVAGVADAYGERSKSKRVGLENLVKRGTLKAFLWEGCRELITEDQKFLLGLHYVDYDSGPHCVPLFNDKLEYYDEKKLFEEQVFAEE